MPEPVPNADQDGKNTGGSTSAVGAAFTPIGSQDDLNRVIADRISRERARFADYDDLKAKAAKFDAAEAANLSELEKAQKAAADATTAATVAQQEALRLRVAVAKGLPAGLVDRLRGASEQEMTEDADELLRLVTPSTTGQGPAPRPDLTQGAHGGSVAGDPAQEFASFLKGQMAH